MLFSFGKTAFFLAQKKEVVSNLLNRRNKNLETALLVKSPLN